MVIELVLLRLLSLAWRLFGLLFLYSRTLLVFPRILRIQFFFVFFVSLASSTRTPKRKSYQNRGLEKIKSFIRQEGGGLFDPLSPMKTQHNLIFAYHDFEMQKGTYHFVKGIHRIPGASHPILQYYY